MINDQLVNMIYPHFTKFSSEEGYNILWNRNRIGGSGDENNEIRWKNCWLDIVLAAAEILKDNENEAR